MFGRVKGQIRDALPPDVVRRLRPSYRTVVGTARRPIARYRTRLVQARSPSARAVFGDVYERKVWEGEREDFYSGYGSDEWASRPYVDFLCEFLAGSRRRRPTIVDIGCGDFRVGAQLIDAVQARYVGVDVVPALIDRNQRRFGSDDVRFICLDAVTGDLPTGEILLIRQVLQHLCNADIKRLLSKIAAYEDVFLTEHYLSDDTGVVPNIDMRSGGTIRLPSSAVYLDRRPFSLKSARCVLTVPTGDGWSELRTFHVTPAAEPRRKYRRLSRRGGLAPYG